MRVLIVVGEVGEDFGGEGGNQLRESWEEGDGCTVVWV